MATSTPQLGLRKPAGSDLISVTTDIADNMDKLDAASNKVLGRVTHGINQVGLVGGPIDLNGLALPPITIGTNRLIRMSAKVHVVCLSGPTTVYVLVLEGAVEVGRIGVHSLDVSRATQMSTPVIIVPTAGSHTYKLALKTDGGFVDVDSSSPSYFMLEDIGTPP